MAAYRLSLTSVDLVAAYEADLWDIGQRPDHKVLWGARFFCARIGSGRVQRFTAARAARPQFRGAPVRDVVDRDPAAAADRGLPSGPPPSAGDHVVSALARFLRRVHDHR